MINYHLSFTIWDSDDSGQGPSCQAYFLLLASCFLLLLVCMTWLTLTTGLLAASVAVPLLVLLYFLKLKRREEVVSSTFLWKRAVQDLQVNAPFQRIRRNLLLLLQLLALGAVLVALAGPVLALRPGAGRRYVILIDRSASMQATDAAEGPGGSKTRLDQAKQEAKRFVEGLAFRWSFSPAGGSDQVMVVAFDEHPKVMCTFTADKRQLMQVIDSVEPVDRLSCLAEVMTVARAFTTTPGTEANNRTSEEPARLVLFSDGRIQDLAQITAGKEELTFYCVGRSNQNVAVTAMEARRPYDAPDKVEIFAAVANYQDSAITADVQVSIDSNVVSVRPVTISPARRVADTNALEPGKATVEVALSYGGGGVIEIRQMIKDLLACDDAAWSVLAPPRRLSILLVTAGNPVLEAALRSCPVAKVDKATAAAFAAMDQPRMSIDQPYDVIVLDNVEVTSVPKGRFLVFGRPPPGIEATVTGTIENTLIADWRSGHTVLRHCNLASVFVAKGLALSLPRDAQVLAEFSEGPAMAAIHRQGSTFLLVAFDTLQSNWPFESSYILFCYNALDFLALQTSQAEAGQSKVGEPIVVQGLAAGAEVAIEGPSLDRTAVKADEAGEVRLPPTQRAGIYRLSAAGRPPRSYAANLLDAPESDILPARQLGLASGQVQAESGPVKRANVPLWPILVIAALGLVCAEWWVYSRRMRI
jgi:hypothetical protein